MLKDTVLKFLKLDGFVERLTEYVETRVELIKVEVKEDIAKATAKLALIFVLAFSFLIFLLFISVALAFWISQSTGITGGFAIVAAGYLLIAIVLFLFKESINKNLEKKIVEAFRSKKK